jgi:biotin carboxyl carrier protein
MSVEVEINGRTRLVQIEAVGRASFRVIVDGTPHDVEVAVTALGLSLRFADGRIADAAVTERASGEWLVQWPRVGLTALVDKRRHAHGAPAAVSVAGEQRVTAPMPGRVLRVLVAPGQMVEERQGLVVVEAMKMENEIGAPKAGRVKHVDVSEGVSIEAGRLLAIVE